MIGVGDTVRIVHWPCCGACLGRIFVVERFEREQPGGARCGSCNAFHAGYEVLALYSRGRAAPLPWVRKIPPLAELERQEISTAA